MSKNNHTETNIQSLMIASGVSFGTSGVRGLVTAMTDELCFAYTLAFLKVIAAEQGGKVAIAIDLRPSSPNIAAACAAAIEESGLQVDYCGALPTPALAYYAQKQAIPGIMVTGSHIPFDRNGIKFYGMQGEITKQDEAAISSAIVHMPNALPSLNLPEANQVATQLYLNRYLDFFPKQCLAGMRLGFYEHSSVARDLFSHLLEALGAEMVSLGRTDVFVPIDTEAVSQVDVDQAKHWAKEVGFDAIISTDGDADRPLIGDEYGNWFRGDIVGMLCAQYLDAGAVATPVSCNTAIELSESFPHVARTRIGSPYVIAAMESMLSDNLPNVVGFEANGGFLLGSNIVKNERELSMLMTRDAVLPIIALFAMAKEKGVAVSQLLNSLPARFTASDRLQSFPIETSKAILKTLSATLGAVADLLKEINAKPLRLDQTDGLRIYLDNGEIVHFRPSGNAPELRCYAEANSQDRANQLAATCLRIMREYSQSY